VKITDERFSDAELARLVVSGQKPLVAVINGADPHGVRAGQRRKWREIWAAEDRTNQLLRVRTICRQYEGGGDTGAALAAIRATLGMEPDQSLLPATR
jgi:nanoRNase/pAp phosphatase (c-di-AMP/oligoRNAs hydrolase)